MKKVLFVCIGNSGRSQMAEAFAKRIGEGVITAESAGTSPAECLNPTVVQAMAEIGYDLTNHYPKSITREMVDSADKIIVMGCKVDPGYPTVCPAVFLPSEDWGIADPEGRYIEDVRKIRDEIRARVEKLVADMLQLEKQG